MAVKQLIPFYDGLFFITLTCSHWQNLFETASSYHTVYNWFNSLKRSGHFVISYVIMPNHLHAMIAFTNTQGLSINKIVGAGKRFMAYDIVKNLTQKNENELLETLSSYVSVNDRKKKKLHEVFEPSFDWKECYTDKFIYQKLNYIHENPCRGKWNLAENSWDYIHSSARFYNTNQHGIYPVTHVELLKDIDLTRGLNLRANG